jgi:hypothetical protein
MPAYWAERINHAVEKTARAVVNTGQELIAAQAKLKHGEWLEMFNTGQVKLKLRAAQKFMQVANNPALAKAANLPLLPPSPTALVALSKLPPEVVEAGIKDGQISPGMSIADAAKFVKGHQPEPASDKGVEDTQEHQPEGASLRNGFLSILWDDAGAPPTRAPEKSYGPKTYPHLAFFRFHEAGDTRIESGTKHDLAHVGLFVVPVEEVRVVKDKQGRAICKATCRLVALSVRGNVPEPSTVPSQVIENGYDGVVEMIASMFPTALKAICTTRAETPNGWQLVPRQSSPVACFLAPPALLPPTVPLCPHCQPKSPTANPKKWRAAGTPRRSPCATKYAGCAMDLIQSRRNYASVRQKRQKSCVASIASRLVGTQSQPWTQSRSNWAVF